MATDIQTLRPYLEAFDLTGLMIEGLGWNNLQDAPTTTAAGGESYDLHTIAEKAGFAVYRCSPNADGSVPPQAIRRQIENQVAQTNYEHLIVFVDAAETQQVWQWVKRESGRPPALRELRYDKGQTGTALLQRLRGIEFTLEEEGNLGITDVTEKFRQSLDVDRVTKHFYDRFRTELTAFQEFIDGFTTQGDRDWYASLMLNRMMFVYFIQKQGFLDRDEHYLRNRLRQVQEQDGPDRFQRFYRHFLLRLFHEGLGQPEDQRPPELTALLGKVPYLNGGIFDPHALELGNSDIDIPDAAFEQIFGFFDQYQWHLDDRPTGADNEINPDVLGYIFEKYVNQKQMGAYYTKEDITGYIARNTVVPRLLEMAVKECPVAFGPDGGVWRLLQDDPDHYIYPSVGHGVAWDYSTESISRLEEPLTLPDDIARGLGNTAQRGDWNQAAPAEYALPTETWRELIARRRHYTEVRDKLAAGEVHTVNNLITLNLDSERFARDVIVNSEAPELVRAVWNALTNISVLDPTCGSGAFLFAALNILEPLYSATMQAMRDFLADLQVSKRQRPPKALQDFQRILDEAGRHRNERYYILKSIIVNNLYGVDIMEEAVEICRLRLFLKLAAQLESYDQVEPLPDIDFNIQAGNSLVGFTSAASVRRAMTMNLKGQQRIITPDEEAALRSIEAKAAEVAREYRLFQQIQTQYGMGHFELAQSKHDLQSKLHNLRSELDALLAKEYGVDANRAAAFQRWQAGHQPFHWFVEFHSIMHQGGFDVVIGNPPYVRTNKVLESYKLIDLATAKCPDIYAAVVERSLNVCRNNGRTGMIVPLSLTFSSHFGALRTHLYEECGSIWFSSFGRIPSALFSFDTRVRNTIYVGQKSDGTTQQCFTTRLHRWYDVQRPTLFENLQYATFAPEPFQKLIPKIGNPQLLTAFETLLSQGTYRLNNELSATRQGYPLHFKQSAYNWLTLCVEHPPAYDKNKKRVPQTKYGTIRFRKSESRDLAILLANGKLNFLWWAASGDDFDLTKTNIASSPIGLQNLAKWRKQSLLALLPELENAMEDNLVFKRNAGKNIGNYNLAKCRQVTDKSDKIWLEASGLSSLWEDVELEYSLVVRTSFDDD